MGEVLPGKSCLHLPESERSAVSERLYLAGRPPIRSSSDSILLKDLPHHLGVRDMASCLS